MLKLTILKSLKGAWRQYRDSNLRTHVLFCLILGINLCLLLLACADMSIHHAEAAGVFYSDKLAFVLARFSMELFGQNDYALRAPFILIHACNMFLLYKISRIYLKKPRDSLIVVLIYALLPGVIFSALLVKKSGLIICITLLCCLYQLKFHKMPYLIMLLAACIDESFAILFFALFFFALKNKNTIGMFVSLLLFALNMYLFGLDFSGIPRNHFLSNLGQMALFFSPLLLIYYCYTLINALKKQNNILVDIGATAMFFVILLSIRQDVDLESLFPMSVVALPVAVKHFFSDMRIRLSPFRASYVRRFGIIFVLLFAQSFVLYCNKILYLFGAQNHFASSYYIGKDIAKALHDRGIEAIGVGEGKLGLVLRFYGIEQAQSPYLLPVQDLNQTYKDEISIIYLGKKIAAFVILPSKQSPHIESKKPIPTK
ncbi:glycosyltransferase family 39 protein [Helicobacter marmotae]|uniref:Glycosyltransferase RgtA/B/C/D-like domain-containing protein n=1 Tax=Helicobacter marmotae TaxID=152490 RepID=A0A3D8I803_9HELI|nr:glycosyltransferase family 39 protein [Helicobacter marmotae]RDU61116.1 hypothetical protein CQA63_01015 [Helicobacter marmotae]